MVKIRRGEFFFISALIIIGLFYVSDKALFWGVMAACFFAASIIYWVAGHEPKKKNKDDKND